MYFLVFRYLAWEGGREGGGELYAIVYDIEIEKFIALPFTLMKTCEFGHFISSLCRNDIEMYRKLRLKAEVLVCTQNLSLLDVSVSVSE